MTMDSFVSRCTGYVIAGGHLYHSGICPLHGTCTCSTSGEMACTQHAQFLVTVTTVGTTGVSPWVRLGHA